MNTTENIRGSWKNSQSIIDAITRTADVKIVVFGDYALDKYLYSDPANDEISAETGENAFRIHRKQMMAGVGGTITNNLRSMGAQVRCIGLIGNDGEGMEMLSVLEKIGADTSQMVKSDSLCTCTYQKLLRKHEDGVYRELRRLDFRNFTEPSMELQSRLLQELDTALDWADAVIITDQFYQRNMSSVTDYIREELSKMAAVRTDKLFYVDSRAFLNEYRNMIVKCNNIELLSLLQEQDVDGGIQSNADQDKEDDLFSEEALQEITEGGKRLKKLQNVQPIVTWGKNGMVIFDEEPELIPGFRVSGPLDIVGAGDASNAGIVLGLSLGLSMAQAARLACCISSITIQQLNTTGTATVEQVTERLQNM